MLKKLKFMIKVIDHKLSKINKRINVLFVITNEIGLLAQIPILNVLKNDARFKIYFHFDNKNEKTISRLILNQISDVDNATEFTAKFKKWDFIIITDRINIWFHRLCLKIFINHGSGVGNLLIAQGDTHAIDYSCQMALENQADIIFMPSLAFLDHFERDRLDILKKDDTAFFLMGTEKVKKDLPTRTVSSINFEKLNILLSSHWTDSSIFRTFGINIVDFLVKMYPAASLIITSHPKLWTLNNIDGFHGEALKQQILSRIKTNKNISLELTGDPSKFFDTCDFLICDHSSIRIEFSSMGKPVLLFREHQREMTSPVTDILYKNSSILFSSINEIDKVINAKEFSNQSNMIWNNLLFNYFKSYDDQYKERVRDLLLEISKSSSLLPSEWKNVKVLQEINLIEARPQLINLRQKFNELSLNKFYFDI